MARKVWMNVQIRIDFDAGTSLSNSRAIHQIAFWTIVVALLRVIAKLFWG